ncbi:uncharacterized protein LOC107266796 [Cephus cinctus]|uniref:Uncharacterized protein LOC107266796 n=1 Tax=Cephus cinctus TaxID=211228 RepID=A0AAJ7BSE2_CEPCN|nr:uncharacterized protein LOC107266796 [Cephus cinctus]
MHVSCRLSAILFFILWIILIASIELALGAPSVCITSVRQMEQSEPPSTMSVIASKAMGAMVKAASYLWQWLPKCVHPPPTSFRMIRPSSNRYESNDIFQSDEDFD